MNRKITLLAFAGNGGALGASGLRKGVTPSAATAWRARNPSEPKQRRQGDRAKAAADLPEKLAPGAAAE